MVAHFGRLDGAINAAGVEGARGPIHKMPVFNFDEVFGVNARGTFLCMREEIKQMLKQKLKVLHQDKSENVILLKFLQCGCNSNKKELLDLRKKMRQLEELWRLELLQLYQQEKQGLVDLV